jgi:SAM-dependent methyltransferase
MSIREQWQAGVQNEVDFWRAVFVGKQFPDFKQDMLQRMEPDRPLMGWIAGKLPADVPISEVRVLDVAAGPISCVGWQINGQRPQIVPIDALATQYRMILDEFGLVPPAYTQSCDGEDIDRRFPPESFDIVHIRNALDHCYDALTVVRNMLRVLKPGGSLLIHGFTDEAEFEKYDGLHQWNIRADDGRLVIWRPGVRHDVNQLFADQLAWIEAMQSGTRWTAATLTKKH